VFWRRRADGEGISRSERKVSESGILSVAPKVGRDVPKNRGNHGKVGLTARITLRKLELQKHVLSVWSQFWKGVFV